jgi:hypothetical protein
MMQFETDDKGNVILRPMTGWELRHVANTLLIMGIEYVESEEELERGEHKAIAFVLRPDLAIAFAEKLKTEASKLLLAQNGASIQ